MRGARIAWAGVLAAVLSAGVAAQPRLELRRVQEIAPGFPVADHRLVDLTGDGAAELLVVGEEGALATYGEGRDAPLVRTDAGGARLPEPARCLLALAALGGQGPPGLLVVSSRDVSHYRPDAEGAIDGPAEKVPTELPPDLRRGRERFRFPFRTGRPQFADIVQDVNDDGRPDLVVPRRGRCDLWLNADAKEGDGDGGSATSFRLAARIAVDVDRRYRTSVDRLSDVLESSFSVPPLGIRDVNGDGRRDLLVEDGDRRAFHLQRADGSLPDEPDATVRLGVFRDTTPKASVRPGRTLAGSDRTRMEIRDLDNDGIPDYLIAHRRKVWVFHGTSEGPQFKEPTTILRTADDITALFLVRLDDDSLPDLLILKVQVPTVATLLLGMLGEWEVEVEAFGYGNEGGRRFSSSPRWKDAVTFQLPSVTKILKDPGAILSRFESASRKFRRGALADLDGDGRTDVLLASEDLKTLEVWRGRDGSGPASLEMDLESVMRQVLFEDEDRVWTLDRVLDYITNFAEKQAERLTGGGPPDATIPLRDPDTYALADLQTAVLPGVTGRALVLPYRHRKDASGDVFDVFAR